MFIDTHCHLQFKDFDEDRAMVIGNAKKAGVKQFIVPGVNISSSHHALELAQQHPGVVFASLGIHPYEADHNPDILNLEKLLLSSRQATVAIGEIGLDYHLYKDEKATGKKDKQKRLFEKQLDLALTYNLLVIMHCRDAFEDFFDVLDSLPKLPKGVIHCFSGGLQELRFAQKRNLLIGVDGNLTYSKNLQTIIPHVPLSMILLETDAPYLTPLPHRGERNEPKYIPLIAKTIAVAQDIAVSEVAKQTTANAHTLFQITDKLSIIKAGI